MLYKELLASPATLVEQASKQVYPELESYISFLSQSMGRKLDDLDVSKIVGLEVHDGKLRINAFNKSEINRVVHEFVPPAPSIVIPPDFMAGIKSASTSIAEQRLAGIRAEITRISGRVASLNRDLMAQFESMSKMRMEEDLINGKGADFALVEQIQRVAADGFWMPYNYSAVERKFEFRTASDVWLSYSDPESGIAKKCNMGRFYIKIRFNSNGITTYAGGCGDNIIVSGHPHPHLYGDGNFCLGNAAGSYEAAINKHDVYSVLHIARLLLTEYNENNPITSFGHYETERDNRDKLRLGAINERNIRNHYEARLANEHSANSDSIDIDWDDATVEELVDAI